MLEIIYIYVSEKDDRLYKAIFIKTEMEDYKVCILAAGIGSRMGLFTKTFNKALIPVQGKPAICHIIEKFGKNLETVVAVGHKKETVIDYLSAAYPDRGLNFVEVDKYTGLGTGPGYSLLQCSEHLQSPFIFLSVDTLVREEIPKPSENWMGLAKVSNTERFCSAKILDSKVIRIDDKVKTDNEFGFIGLAGIKDYEFFWDELESNQNIIGGEIQVSNGLSSLIERGLNAKTFTWFDVGTPDSYEHAVRNYPDGKSYGGE